MPNRRFFPVDNRIPYGTMYWIERQADADWFQDDLTAIRRMGMNTIRTFVYNPEAAPDTYDYAQLDALFDVAADVGIQLCPTFTHSLSPWRARAIGYDPRLSVQVPYLLDDPAYCAQLEPGLSSLVSRYRGHPALWSWILWNEPSRSNTMPPPPPTWRLFPEWLVARYGGDIGALNQVWFPDYQPGFEDFGQISPWDIAPEWHGVWRDDPSSNYVPVHPQALRMANATFGGGAGRRWTNAGTLRDWVTFNMERLTANIRWLHDLVRAADPDTPTHVNPDGFAKNQPEVSRDLVAIGRTVDIMGASLHAGHHFALLDAETHFCEAFSYYTQRIVGACKDGHTVLTELQAGPNTWSGNKNFNPDSEDLVQWNLVALGQGVRGAVYWLWRPRFHGWEGGEWGLMGGNGQPTPSTRGAAEIGRLIDDHGEWLGRLEPAPAKVAILWSQDTEIVTLRETGPRHTPSEYSTRSEYGCFRALWRAGIPAEMVTTDEIRAGILGRFRCLMIPYGEAMDQATGKVIGEWVQAGGWLYGETPLANKNERGSAYRATPGAGLSSVFPTTLDMWPARTAPTVSTAYGAIHAEAFIQPLAAEGSVSGGESLGSVRGYPVIWDSPVGLGRTRFVGTCLCLYAGRHDDATAEFALLADFARRAGCAPEYEVQSAGHAPAYWLLDPEGRCDALIIVNDSNLPNPVQVTLSRPYSRIDEMLDGLDVEVDGATVRLTLGSRRGAVLRMAR